MAVAQCLLQLIEYPRRWKSAHHINVSARDALNVCTHAGERIVEVACVTIVGALPHLGLQAHHATTAVAGATSLLGAVKVRL